MATSITEHTFNNDLLLSEQDRSLAARKYTTIFHILDHKDLREFFSEYDVPANQAKRLARRFGLISIGLVFFALMGAAIEQSFHHGDEHGHGAFILAFVSAVAGIAGVVFGSVGLLHSKRKRQWLLQRLVTERSRQFHFQTFVFRLPELLDSLRDDAAKEEFHDKRKLWFESFRQNLLSKLDSHFVSATDEGGDLSAHEGRAKPPRMKDLEALLPLFAAYRELRIDHQIGYANYQLSGEGLPLRSGPRAQAVVLSTIGFVSIAALCAIHGLVLFLLLFAPSAVAQYSAAAGFIAISCAIVALGARALEQGLQPERELERYERYRSELKTLLRRFDEETAPADKLQVMYEVEQLAYEEMCDFMRINGRARFVM